MGRAESETPLTDFQIVLSKAVDQARALPREQINEAYTYLVGLYLQQIREAVTS